ncbi:hypothetical protein [Pseudomonas sp.]|jgi:hypothetical protein|uniref:hypothetical protein n=1 Tax=Pseudomonas sp. TaxID=306 RepID=UPI0028AC961A|nr:hypothetical protein [Pseudomonas sp.]
MELTKTMVDCMQKLRRRLRDELAVDIRLSQTDAIMAMLLACQESANEDTRAMGEHLSELTGVRLKAPELTEEQLIEKYTRYAGPLRG